MLGPGLHVLRNLAAPFLKRRFDVIFYAQSWIDEVWMRTTMLECRRRRISCAIVTDGPADEASRHQLAAAGIVVIENADPSLRRRLRAPVMISASSGVPRDAFSDSVGLRVHMPHSIVSLHMIYAEDSFDGFDVLFAAGPHHVREFEALSRHRGLTGRRSYPVGYGKADLLPEDTATVAASETLQVLIAPSWGPNGLLPQCGLALVGALLAAGMRVTLRPHPLHILNRDAALTAIREAFGDHDGFSVEHPDLPPHAMQTADVLITDYSGTAFEFSLSRRRPVVFVDVPKKVMNPAWESLGIGAVEVDLRDRIGVIAPAEPSRVVEVVSGVAGTLPAWPRRIDQLTELFVFRRHGCGIAAADALETLLGGRVQAVAVS